MDSTVPFSTQQLTYISLTLVCLCSEKSTPACACGLIFKNFLLAVLLSSLNVTCSAAVTRIILVLPAPGMFHYSLEMKLASEQVTPAAVFTV